MIQFLGKAKSVCYMTQKFQYQELILRRKKGTKMFIVILFIAMKKIKTT